MKKRILAVLLVLLCLITCLAGCNIGSFIENNGKGNQGDVKPADPDNPDNPDNPDVPVEPAVPDTHYTVALYYQNKPFIPGELEITVVWENESTAKRVPLGKDGKADAGELSGEYGIHLEGLPDAYVYNPKTAHATYDEHKVTILLANIRNPERGDGKGLYASEGCYSVRYDGTYRAKINKEGEYVYYEYTPTSSGVYSIESWANVYEDKINPVVRKYSGSIAYKFNPVDIDGGGYSLDGGYTQNFRYECMVDKKEVGSAFTFAVTAKSRTGEYPVYVDFAITYEGKYTNPSLDVRTKRAEQALVKAAEPKPGEVFTFADERSLFGGGAQLVFDEENFRYNPNTGYYHLYDEVRFADNQYKYGKGFGPILCCALTKTLPSYSTTTLYKADFVGLGQNLLKIYNVWLEDEKKYCVYDYTNFIKVAYYKVCNSDGVCYITEELKEFLQKFAEHQALWTDRVAPVEGSPEENGYTANKSSMWLFACGVYL